MAAASLTALLNKKTKTTLPTGPERSGTIQLPPEEEWLSSGTLEKRVFTSHEVWPQRRVVLTKEVLAVTRVDSSDILDRIYLVGIESLEFKKANIKRVSTVSSPAVADQGSAPAFDPVGPALAENHDKLVQQNAFDIVCSAEGYNEGRTYTFCASTREESQEWITKIREASALAKHNAEARISKLDKFRFHLKCYYDSRPAQLCVAFIIISSFCVSCLNAELVPDEGSDMFLAFEYIDIAFTIIFTVEVVVNLMANWWTPFWSVGWNVFDFVVVAASLIALPLDSVPGFTSFRLLRVFRVVRLFNRLKSLRKIITALTASLLPVANAFLVLVLVTLIYAVLAVHFFKQDSPYFQNFSASVFSMFQISTGDSWASGMVRPMFGDTGTEIPYFPTAFFFFSYILVVGTFLLNVVIAVLLDEFISAVEKHKAARKHAEEEQRAIQERQQGGPLDPLLLTLAALGSESELWGRISLIYQILDANDSGGLSYEETKDGLRRLQFDPPLHLSEEEWDSITDGGRLCGERGELDEPAFASIMKHQLDLFVRRHLAKKTKEAESDPSTSGVFFVLNQIMRRLEIVERDGAASKEAVLGLQSGASSTTEEGKVESAAVVGPASKGGGGAVSGPVSSSRQERLEGEVRALHRKIDEQSATINRLVSLLEGGKAAPARHKGAEVQAESSVVGNPHTPGRRQSTRSSWGLDTYTQIPVSPTTTSADGTMILSDVGFFQPLPARRSSATSVLPATAGPRPPARNF